MKEEHVVLLCRGLLFYGHDSWRCSLLHRVGGHEAVQGGRRQDYVGNKFFEVLSRVQMYEFTSLRRDNKDYETI
jgi:hypothetical protein